MVSRLPVTGDPPTECVPYPLCWVPGSSRRLRRAEPEPVSSWRPKPARSRELGRQGARPRGPGSCRGAEPRAAWEQPGVLAARGRHENTRGTPLCPQLLALPFFSLSEFIENLPWTVNPLLPELRMHVMKIRYVYYRAGAGRGVRVCGVRVSVIFRSRLKDLRMQY